MDAHKIERAHVLGHSMGGKVAMELALTAPERVDRLVVVDIAPRAYEPRHRVILDALQAIDPARYDSRRAIDEALAAHVPEAPIRQFLLKNLQYDPDTRRYTWQMDLEADSLLRPHQRGHRRRPSVHRTGALRKRRTLRLHHGRRPICHPPALSCSPPCHDPGRRPLGARRRARSLRP